MGRARRSAHALRAATALPLAPRAAGRGARASRRCSSRSSGCWCELEGYAARARRGRAAPRCCTLEHVRASAHARGARVRLARARGRFHPRHRAREARAACSCPRPPSRSTCAPRRCCPTRRASRTWLPGRGGAGDRCASAWSSASPRASAASASSASRSPTTIAPSATGNAGQSRVRRRSFRRSAAESAVSDPRSSAAPPDVAAATGRIGSSREEGQPALQGALELAAGPERIEAGWWDGARGAARLLRRHQRARRDVLDLPRASRSGGVVPARSVRMIPGYAELHCLTNFTLPARRLRPGGTGRSAPCELGYAALAITDECSVAGVVRAHVAAKEAGLKLIVGTRVHAGRRPEARAAGAQPARLRDALRAHHAGAARGPEGRVPAHARGLARSARGAARDLAARARAAAARTEASTLVIAPRFPAQRLDRGRAAPRRRRRGRASRRSRRSRARRACTASRRATCTCTCARARSCRTC